MKQREHEQAGLARCSEGIGFREIGRRTCQIDVRRLFDKKTGKFSFFSQTEFFISIFAPDK